jgi:drug/metabolite transporter (DMT)-like permease
MAASQISKGSRNGMVLLAGLAFGTSVVMSRIGLYEIPPLWLVLLRLATATAGFAVVLAVLRRSLPRTLRQWRDIILVGICNVGVPLVAFTLSLQFISSGVLTILLALIPLFTGLLAHFWLAQEKLSRYKLMGLILSLAGVLFLLATRTTGIQGNGAGIDLRGYGLALAGTLSTAFAAVYTRLRLHSVDVVTLTAGQMAAGAVVVMPFALLLSDVNFAAVSWRGWSAVVYCGLIGSCLAFLLMFSLIQRFGATSGALPGYVVPVVSILLGAILLGEVVSGSLLVGAGVTLAGVFLANR